MHEQLFERAGLNEKQAKIYACLIENGALTGKKISQITNIPRTLSYKTLKDLIRLKFVLQKREIGKITKFFPENPIILYEKIKERKNNFEKAIAEFNSIAPTLLSQYNLILEKPGIKFFEGIKGFQEIYNDIVQTNENIFLVRAITDERYEKDVAPIIKKHREKRVKKNLWVDAITPKDKMALQNIQKPQYDKEQFFRRTLVDIKDYNVPVEIDIYGNKTAFLSFGKEFLGMIIESPQIAKAMKQIFELAKKGSK